MKIINAIDPVSNVAATTATPAVTASVEPTDATITVDVPTPRSIVSKVTSYIDQNPVASTAIVVAVVAAGYLGWRWRQGRKQALAEQLLQRTEHHTVETHTTTAGPATVE